MAEKRNIKALVVDDERMICNVLSRILSIEGVNTKTAENGEQACSIAAKEHFDLFFIDVRMPQMNGVQVLRELKKINPNATYIMMTGYAVDDLLHEAAQEGIKTSLRKPFDMEEIIQLIGEKWQGQEEKINILIIDDEPLILSSCQQLLTNKGYTVKTAKNTVEALEIVKNNNIDLLFIDVVLGDANGVELYNQICAIKPGIEVVFITGHPEQFKEIHNTTVNKIIAKPFGIDVMVAAIEKIKKNKN
jgi:two-component system response regulator (stage 0 sporulation protein F)